MKLTYLKLRNNARPVPMSKPPQFGKRHAKAREKHRVRACARCNMRQRLRQEVAEYVVSNEH